MNSNNIEVAEEKFIFNHNPSNWYEIVEYLIEVDNFDGRCIKMIFLQKYL